MVFCDAYMWFSAGSLISINGPCDIPCTGVLGKFAMAVSMLADVPVGPLGVLPWEEGCPLPSN